MGRCVLVLTKDVARGCFASYKAVGVVGSEHCYAGGVVWCRGVTVLALDDLGQGEK